MNIYLDESGTFIVPKTRTHRVCCVGGLVIPTASEGALCYEFLRIRDTWPVNPIEVKGSKLDEDQVASVIDLLARHDALLQVVATDMALYTAASLEAVQRQQAARLLKHMTPQHQPTLVAQMTALRDRWLRTPSQLFVQSILTIHLLEELFQAALLFYVQRIPAELGAFRWVVDAKDRTLTEAEEIWKTLFMAFLQTGSLKKPLMHIRGADYSYFRPFEIDESTTDEKARRTIEFLIAAAPPEQGGSPFTGVDMNRVFQQLRFADSKSELGVQLADISVSACSRAFNGTLKIEGWRRLGSILAMRNGGEIHFVELSVDPQAVGTTQPLDESLAVILREIKKGARSMWKN